jgi:hypothetical protein
MLLVLIAENVMMDGKPEGSSLIMIFTKAPAVYTINRPIVPSSSSPTVSAA